MEICETPENVLRNLRANLAKDYTRLNEFLNTESGPVSIIGSGPSLKDTYQDFTGDLIACNAALSFLLDKGIVPKYAMFFDAAEIMTKFVVPHPEVTYLVASRCHPQVLEMLSECKVIVWHVKCGEDSDEPIDDLLDEFERPEPMVHGGSAAVTRAMLLADALGYTEQHLFGADSSYAGDDTHIRKSIVEEQELMVFVEGRWFKTTPWLAGQVEDFKILSPELTAWGRKIVVHGRGLLPFVAKIRGYETPNL